jgi:hypothetical protein
MHVYIIENLLYTSAGIHDMEHLGTRVAPQIHNIRKYDVYIKLVAYVVQVWSLFSKLDGACPLCPSLIMC